MLHPDSLKHTHTHRCLHSLCQMRVRAHPHIPTWSSSKGVNNYFAKGHNCDPWLVFKALSLNLNHPSSPWLPLVKWKCPFLGLIQRSQPWCLLPGLQLILPHSMTQTPSLNFHIGTATCEAICCQPPQFKLHLTYYCVTRCSEVQNLNVWCSMPCFLCVRMI